MWMYCKMWFISVIKAEFSSHMIFRNHNNMLICCSRNISDYYQCWKQLCCFVVFVVYFIFLDSLMNKTALETSLQAICHTFSSLNVSCVGLFLNSFLSTFTDWKCVAYVWLKPHFLMRIYYCCSLFSLCVFSKRVAASLPKSTSEL